MIHELAKRNRSYRRFNNQNRISTDRLRSWVELASLVPSSRNQQALKFSIKNEAADCAMIYRHLAWAGYLPDWNGPVETERPVAYIIIYGDTRIGKDFQMDTGIVAQTILLAAVEDGYGGCMIGSIKREALRKELELPDYLQPVLVLALGIPEEQVKIEKMLENEIKYYRTSDGVHHVPKRAVQDIIVDY